LLIGVFLRFWQLGSAPPGLSNDELVNVQLADHMRQGEVSVVYNQVTPGREGLYYAYLALATEFMGRGLILWRLPSIWLSMLAMAATATLFRRLFGSRVSLMATGLMAVSFWPVWMGRAVLHVTVMPFLAALTFYVLTRTFQSQSRSASALWFTASGLLLGISQYAHVSAWVLLLIPVGFIVQRWFSHREDITRHWGNIFYGLILFIIVNIPLGLFVLRNPGARGSNSFVDTSLNMVSLGDKLLQAVLSLFVQGDTFVNHNLPGRPILDPLVGVLAVIGLGVAISRRRQPAYTIVLIWLGLGLIPEILTARKADFEFLAVLMPVIFLLPAIGLRSVYVFILAKFKNLVSQRLLRLIISGGIGLLLLNTAWHTGWDYIVTWATLDDVKLAYGAEERAIAHYLDTDVEPTPVSICSTPVDHEERPFALTNAELLGYLMHRSDLHIRFFDCSQTLVLANGAESQRLIFARGKYYGQMPGPLLAWMKTSASEDIPGVSQDVIMRIDASDEIADRAGAFITTAPVAWPPESGEFRLVQLPISFESNVTFLGYEVRDTSLHPGDYVELITYWRLDGPPPPQLTMFAHLLGSPVVVLAQNDSLGVDISKLETRDVFIQYSLIQIPAGIAPGMYPLSIGIYTPGSGARLKAFENGQARADRLFLLRVDIR
jgi:hypothetical protein